VKIGDIVQPVAEICAGMNHTQILPHDRYIHIGDEPPWDEYRGMIGETHEFPCGTLGIYLGEKVVHPRLSEQRIFYKIITSDGKIGWIHESWVRRIQ
jgi:hypothetical protein